MNRKTPFVLLALPLIAVTACSTEEDDPGQEDSTVDATEWFSENCAAEVSSVYVDFDSEGEPVGEPSGQALTQGAIRAPEDISGGSTTIGIYSYDETAETMTYESDVESGELFCLEQDILDQDRWQLLKSSEVDGEAAEQGTEVSFAKMRSPVHPEGVWLEYDYGSQMGWSTEGQWDDCPDEWSPATDITDVESATEQEEPIEADRQVQKC